MEKQGDDFLKRISIVCQIAGGVPSLASSAGVSVSAIRKYLAGSEPTRPVLISMAKAAGVRSGWLLDGLGLVCDPDSSLMQQARHLLGREFKSVLMLPDYQDEGKVGAAMRFSEEYQQGYERSDRPEWLRLVIPKFSADEVTAWRAGQLDYVSVESNRIEGNISKSAEEVAFISSAIRAAYGPRIELLSLGMEAAIFSQMCDLGGRVKLSEMPPDMLSKFIQTFAYQFDPKAQGGMG